MADKYLYIPLDDTQNYPFCRLQLVVESLETQLNRPTNQNSLKFSKFKPIRKRNLNTLGTSVMNSSLSPVSIYISRELGTFDCKLHWSPKF